MSSQTKRANFEVTTEQEARLTAAKEALQASSLRDAVLRMSSVMLVLARELAHGKRLYVGDRAETAERLVLPEIEAVEGGWRWLVALPVSTGKCSTLQHLSSPPAEMVALTAVVLNLRRPRGCCTHVR